MELLELNIDLVNPKAVTLNSVAVYYGSSKGYIL